MSFRQFEYSVRLNAVSEVMSGRFGVAFKVPGGNGRGHWYVAVPGLEHIAGPFATRNRVRDILVTDPKGGAN